MSESVVSIQKLKHQLGFDNYEPRPTRRLSQVKDLELEARKLAEELRRQNKK